MIRAYRLFTGSDGNSHIETGGVVVGAPAATQSVVFSEGTPVTDWHTAPRRQYVIFLSGVSSMHGRRLA
jgi:quercetin dioxygenase-like cupin family protein